MNCIYTCVFRCFRSSSQKEKEGCIINLALAICVYFGDHTVQGVSHNI